MSEQTTTEDVQAQNIALYRRFADGVGTGRLDAIDEVLAADIQLPTIADLADHPGRPQAGEPGSSRLLP